MQSKRFENQNSIAALLWLKLKVDNQSEGPVANHEEDWEGRKDPEMFAVSENDIYCGIFRKIMKKKKTGISLLVLTPMKTGNNDMCTLIWISKLLLMFFLLLSEQLKTTMVINTHLLSDWYIPLSSFPVERALKTKRRISQNGMTIPKIIHMSTILK